MQICRKWLFQELCDKRRLLLIRWKKKKKGGGGKKGSLDEVSEKFLSKI